jgi:hypothetical protein
MEEAEGYCKAFQRDPSRPPVFDLAQSRFAIGRYLIAMAGQSLFLVVSCICLGGLDRTANAPVGAAFSLRDPRRYGRAPRFFDMTAVDRAWAQHCQSEALFWSASWPNDYG